MPNSEQRMRILQEMLQSQPDDLFLLYAIALEHRKMGNSPAALQSLFKVLEKDRDYCAAYQQAGQIHEQAGEVEAAREVYRQGIVAAARNGDHHAKQEMEQALNLLD